MGIMPSEPLKLETMRKYIQLVGGIIQEVRLKQPRDEQGVSRTGGSTSTIVLATTASSSVNYYVGLQIKVALSSNKIEERKIIAYNSTTKIATVETEFTAVPDSKPYNIRVFEIITPLVRFENSNKALFRKIYNQANSSRTIITNNDSFRFPLITYKYSGMNMDTDRFGVSSIRIEGDKVSSGGTYNTITQYIGSPVPYSFNFSISMWSNLYSHLLDLIENIVYVFQPANTFTVTMLKNSDNSLKLLHDTVIYLNSVSIPTPVDVIDENTNEPIQSVTIDLVVKGYIFPPIKNAKIINRIIETFNVTDDVDDSTKIYATWSNEITE